MDMKKTYSIPTSEVVNIKFHQNLLIGSADIYEDPVSDPGILLAPEQGDLPDLPIFNLPGMK